MSDSVSNGLLRLLNKSTQAASNKNQQGHVHRCHELWKNN